MKNIPDPDNMSADSKPWSIGTEFPQVFPTQTDPGKAMCADSVAARCAVISRTADTPADTHFYVVITDAEATSANHAAYTVTQAYYVEKGLYIVYDGSAWETYDAPPTDATYTQVY